MFIKETRINELAELLENNGFIIKEMKVSKRGKSHSKCSLINVQIIPSEMKIKKTNSNNKYDKMKRFCNEKEEKRLSSKDIPGLFNIGRPIEKEEFLNA